MTAEGRAAHAAPSAPGACYHCGTPIAGKPACFATIDDAQRSMCCPGCQAVAQAIVAAGHAAYYRNRTATAERHEALPQELSDLFDRPSLRDAYVRQHDDGTAESDLLIEGITCGACVWLLERHLGALRGVRSVTVNHATHRLQVVWDAGRTRLSNVLAAIQAMGYTPHPTSVRNRHALAARERRTQLRRLGIAGLLGMQIMTLAVALYAGEWYGMEAEFRTFFRWVSLFLATPVVLYGAQPFFAGAWRDLKHGAPGMDVPVALGVGLAYCASVGATFADSGEVYYDSVAMFTFLLLAARFVEAGVRRGALDALDKLVASSPETANRLTGDGRTERVPALELRPDDRVLLRPGDRIPADGVIAEGSGSVDESLLSGESSPVRKGLDDRLIAGSVNVDKPMTMRVHQCGDDTLLAAIIRLAENAQHDKPPGVRLADRVAVVFVSGVLALTALVGAYWFSRGESAWFSIVLAMLVVSCPCALSLAAPSAIAATLGRLMSLRVLVAHSGALEALAGASHFVFDKTGTLTDPLPAILAVRTLQPDTSADACRRIAAALEAHSNHPIAHALRQGFEHVCAAEHAGADTDGLSGIVDGERFWLGSRGFIARHTGQHPVVGADEGTGYCSVVYLSNARHALASFELRDRIRDQAQELVGYLRSRNKHVWLLSGDHRAAAQRVARDLGIDHAEWALTPQNKLARVRQLQSQGAAVAMIGDGINDAPVLAQSDVSIAMGGGASLAALHADMVLLGDRLGVLRSVIESAARTRRVIVQNLSWAVTYNLLALPAAAFGLVPPWLAAIGMSLSSLLVVGNAWRLKRTRP